MSPTTTWTPIPLALADAGFVDSLGWPDSGFGDWSPLSTGGWPALRRLGCLDGANHYGWAISCTCDAAEDFEHDTDATDPYLAAQYWSEPMVAQSVAAGTAAISVKCKSRDGGGGLDTLCWSLSRVHPTDGWKEHLVEFEATTITPPGPDYAGTYAEVAYPAFDVDEGDRLVLEVGFRGSSEGIVLGSGGGASTQYAAVDGDTSGDLGWFSLSEGVTLTGDEVIYAGWNGLSGAEGAIPSLLGIVALGQGASEGMGASLRTNRWLSLVTAQARTFHGSDSTSPGYVPAAYSEGVRTGTPWGAQEFTPVDGATPVDGVVAGETGLGLRLVTVPAVGDGMDFDQAALPASGDPFLPLYVGDSAGFDLLSANSGDWATNLQEGTYAFGWLTCNGRDGEPQHQIRGVADGVPMNVMGAVYMSGPEQLDFAGILPIDGGGAAALAADLADVLSPEDASPALLAIQAAWFVEPGFVFVEFGAQEYVSASHTPTELVGSLLRILGGLQCRYSSNFTTGDRYRPTVVVVQPAEPDSGLVDGGQTHSWSEYRAAIHQAATLAGCGVWDWSLVSPASDDGMYPNDAGHAALAQDATDNLLLVSSGGDEGGTTGPFTGWGIPI